MKQISANTKQSERRLNRDSFFQNLFSNPALARELVKLAYSDKLSAFDFDKLKTEEYICGNKQRSNLIVSVPLRVKPDSPILC